MASKDKTFMAYGRKRTFRAIDGKYYEIKNGKVSKNPSTSFLVTSNLPKLPTPTPKLKSGVTEKPRGFMTGKPSDKVDKPNKIVGVSRAKTSPVPTSRPKNTNTVTGMGGSVDTRKPTAKPTDKAVPTGMGDRKSKTTTKPKDAKNPNAAFNKSRAKQRLASKKLEKLSNKTVRDTSIKGLKDLKAKPTSKPKSPNASAIKSIQERNANAKSPVSKIMLGKIEKELKKGGKPVYKNGKVVGVTHKGLIGTVYTGSSASNPFKKKKK